MINNQEIHSARKSFSQSRIARLLTDIFPKWGRPADKLTPVAKVPRKPVRNMGFMLEALEPRLLLSAELTYGNPVSVPGDITDPGQINDYISALTSTTFELKAEHDSGSGNDYWRLYGTGLTGTDTPALVLEHQITSFLDLDVNITREDFGIHNSTIGLIDFIGDRLTVDMDSLSVLNTKFTGTKIDIDFAGGKDIDLGSILGITLPTFLGNDQLVLSGNAGTFSGHDFTIHSSSDIVNDATGLQITNSGGDLEIISDSKVSIDHGSSLNAANITLKADAKSTGGIVQGLLANASSSVILGAATLTATGGDVQLLAHSDVTFTENGGTFFGNGLSATLVLSLGNALVDVQAGAVINAKDATLEAMTSSNSAMTGQQVITAAMPARNPAKPRRVMHRRAIRMVGARKYRLPPQWQST